MFIRVGGVVTLLLSGFFAVPTSSNYSLKAYDIGGGGGTGSSSSYKLNAISGSQNSSALSSTTYTTNSGEIPTANSNVPPAPTFTNPSSYYDRLKLVINTGGNASDVKFAVAISDDNFVTTKYVKSDNSIGSTLALADYRTYAGWSSASGVLVVGLTANTTYKVKAKAFQGAYSGSAFGPTASAATVQPSLSFGVATVGDPTPPFSISFSSLTLGTVVNASDDASLSLGTNALSGASIYVRDTQGGLLSSTASYTLTSATADLTAAVRGYGAIVTSTSQSSGGPFTVSSPFNGTSNNVGVLSTSLQVLATTSGSVTGGSVTVRFKAKADVTVPESSDYTDALIFVAAGAF